MKATTKKNIVHQRRGKVFILLTVNDEHSTKDKIYEELLTNNEYPLAVELIKQTMYMNRFVVYFYDFKTITELKKLNEDYSWWTLYHWNKEHPFEKYIKQGPLYQEVLSKQRQINYAIKIEDNQ